MTHSGESGAARLRRCLSDERPAHRRRLGRWANSFPSGSKKKTRTRHTNSNSANRSRYNAACVHLASLRKGSGSPTRWLGAVPDDGVRCVQMFNILEQMQKPKAPVVPMAVRLACLSRGCRAPSPRRKKRCITGLTCHLRTLPCVCRPCFRVGTLSASATVAVRAGACGSALPISDWTSVPDCRSALASTT